MIRPYYKPDGFDQMEEPEQDYMQRRIDGMSGWVEWRADDDGGGAWVLDAPDRPDDLGAEFSTGAELLHAKRIDVAHEHACEASSDYL